MRSKQNKRDEEFFLKTLEDIELMERRLVTFQRVILMLQLINYGLLIFFIVYLIRSLL